MILTAIQVVAISCVNSHDVTTAWHKFVARSHQLLACCRCTLKFLYQAASWLSFLLFVVWHFSFAFEVCFVQMCKSCKKHELGGSFSPDRVGEEFQWMLLGMRAFHVRLF